MSAKQVNDVWIECAYRRVNSEEGSYDAFTGYNVIARCPNPDGSHDYYAYTYYIECEQAYVFMDQHVAARFVEFVKAIGYIYPTDGWSYASTENSADLPDYALNPFRPEYN